MTDPEKDAAVHNEQNAMRDILYDREGCLDAQYDFAESRADVTAKFLIAADEHKLIADLLVLARLANAMSGMAGQIHDDSRRKLVYELSVAGRKCWHLYADAHS